MAETVEGLRELQEKLRQFGPKIGGSILARAAGQAMQSVLKQAKASAPIGTEPHKTYKVRLVAPGFLSRNIGSKTFISKDKTFAKAMVGPKREAFYGTAFVERGTSKMAAQPFLVPAYEANRGAVLERFKVRLKAIIEREAKKRR